MHIYLPCTLHLYMLTLRLCVFSSGYYCGVHGKVLLGQCVQQLLCEMVSGGIRICCVKLDKS